MRKFLEVNSKYKKSSSSIKLPNRATKFSAGYDFYSPVSITILPKTMEMIWTDVKAQFNKDEFLLLVVTSSMGKRGVMLANTIGVVDSDYFNNVDNDGNIGFRLYNFSDEKYEINEGDKIGQGIFLNFLKIDNEAQIIETRSGGFGSTNNK